MNLFYRTIGSGKPLIILHGLFGSGDNWYSIARELSSSFTVYLVDQRNHGHSPHHRAHNYSSLASDILEFMEQQKISKATFIGHSMGGKAALQFGLDHPEMVEKMIIVDISPLGYGSDKESAEGSEQKDIIVALKNLDIRNIKTREEADRKLSLSLPSAMVRQFLLKSLKRKKDGTFEWAMNLEALDENMPAIFDGVIHEDITDPRLIPQFPLLFIKGARSGYLQEHDLKAIHHYFPNAEITTIPDSGHWIHAEQPAAFLESIKGFCNK